MCNVVMHCVPGVGYVIDTNTHTHTPGTFGYVKAILDLDTLSTTRYTKVYARIYICIANSGIVVVLYGLMCARIPTHPYLRLQCRTHDHTRDYAIAPGTWEAYMITHVTVKAPKR